MCCYEAVIIAGRDRQIEFIRGIAMKFLAIIRNLQAAAMLAVAAPLLAQAVQAPPEQPPAAAKDEQQIVNTPVLSSEPAVNEPLASSPPAVNPTPVPAPAPKPAPKKGPVDSLKPGQFVWEKRDLYEGPMKIVAVLDIQRIYVFQNDKLLGFSTISSGKKGKETPTGIFNILQKNIDHKSNLYSNAPMPYMQRLTWDGIAMHGGHLPGYPASHGCIRLPHAFAKALFGVTQMNQEVVVLKNTATPIKRPEPKPVPVIEPPVSPPVEPVIDPSVTPPASPPKPTKA
jgi:lipoprotein-anchoring transpeptidase ErfK/SrfK